MPKNVRAAIEDMMSDIEAMYGCCDQTDDGSPTWDEYMKARIKVIRRFLKNESK